MEMMPYRPDDACLRGRGRGASLATSGPAARPTGARACRCSGPGPDAARTAGRGCAVAVRATDDRASGALHLAAAHQRGRLRAVHRWTHRERAAGRYACFAVVPAGETAAVGSFQIRVLDETRRRRRVGLHPGRGVLGHGAVSGRRAARRRLRVRRDGRATGWKRARPSPTGAAKGALAKGGRGAGSGAAAVVRTARRTAGPDPLGDPSRRLVGRAHRASVDHSLSARGIRPARRAPCGALRVNRPRRVEGQRSLRECRTGAVEGRVNLEHPGNCGCSSGSATGRAVACVLQSAHDSPCHPT